MKQEGHLQSYTLTLYPRGPVHCGSGIRYTKKEYLFDARTNCVSILDNDALFRLLVQKECVNRYEAFILGENADLYRFLTRDCGCAPAELRGITRYTLDAGEALDADHSLKEVCGFQRDAYGRAYVPGSGLKGALRTAWLTARILQDSEVHSMDGLLNNQWQNRRDTQWVIKQEAKREAARMENRYANLLRCKLKDGRIMDNAVNDIFRGIEVSDSEPMPDEAIILCGKHDLAPGGNFNFVNVCRESIRPHTPVRFRLTLDTAVLQNKITAESLLQSIQAFNRFYLETYLPHFRMPAGHSGAYDQPFLILGGGAGYFSKNNVYPYLGEEKALSVTVKLMRTLFPQGRHERDEETGISPHMMKYTRFGGAAHPFGVCGVWLE